MAASIQYPVPSRLGLEKAYAPPVLTAAAQDAQPVVVALSRDWVLVVDSVCTNCSLRDLVTGDVSMDVEFHP